MSDQPNRLDVSRPCRFVPFLRPMVWGGRRLADVLGKPLPTSEPYGESWELSDHPLHRSVVAEGPWSGRTLRDLMEHQSKALLGKAAANYSTFPWLVKFLDACDWLSVQVHPDENAVRTLWPGEGSKTEVWFVLDTRPGSLIYAGLRPGIGRTELLAALNAGKVAECLHSFEPRPGDSVFLPAGTVHAVGGGVLMAEVQQTSDATFRLYDWDRHDAQGKTRTLHVEQALACIKWDQGPVQPVSARGGGRQVLASCRYFELEYLPESRPFALGGQGRLQVMVVVKGEGVLEGDDGEKPLTAGQVWLLPAGMGKCLCRPGPLFAALLTTLPDV